MSTSWKPPAPGALDDTPWPEQLTARAVEPGASDDRLHGYSVLGDAARHYAFSDSLFLALTGELPSDEQSALFDLALWSFAAPHVGESPLHLAVLVRVSGAPLASALATGLIAATDHARALVAQQLEALTTATQPDAWVATLREAIAARGLPDVVKPELTKDGARIALLQAAGLRTADQMEAAIVAARVGAIAAEAMATGPQDLSAYPVKVPPFHYVEGGALRK